MSEQIISALRGCGRIIHAGDIGSVDVLLRLECIAPVTAVYGNCDFKDLGDSVHQSAEMEISGVRFFVTHRDRDAVRAFGEYDVVVHGHTHRRRRERIEGTLVVNPGSASEPRDGLPASVAVLDLGDGFVRGVTFVDIV
jgi:putative phosphoesterase